MRTAEFKGRKIRLTEGQHKKLTARFNLKNARKQGIRWIINKPCICDEFSECKNCPFHFMNTKSSKIESCKGLSRKIGGFNYFTNNKLFLCQDYILWTDHHNFETREGIKKIYDTLMSMKRDLPF